MAVRPSAQFSLTLRVELDRRPGQLGMVASAIGEAGGSIGAIDSIELGDLKAIREITVMCSDQEHSESIIVAVEQVPGCTLLEVTDRTFELHRGGKLYTGLKSPIKTRDDLSMAYTPGVGRVCMAIHDEPEKAFEYTIKSNTVAVVTDGSAVLGLDGRRGKREPDERLCQCWYRHGFPLLQARRCGQQRGCRWLPDYEQHEWGGGAAPEPARAGVHRRGAEVGPFARYRAGRGKVTGPVQLPGPRHPNPLH